MAQFSQYNLPDEEPQNNLNIIPAPNGSILTDGSFQSPNYVRNDRGWKVDSEGNAEFQSLKLGGRTISLFEGQSIQGAVDELRVEGGGKVALNRGTYSLTSDLTIYSNIDIVGEDGNNTIIDFGGTASSLVAASENLYTTGTITSISSGVLVEGSGTSWTADMAGRHMFIGTRWYLIASVTDSDSLVLAEGFADDSISFPGASYRIASTVRDVLLKDFTVRNSSTDGIDLTDVRNLEVDNVVSSFNGGAGFKVTNFSHSRVSFCLMVGNTSDGYQFNNFGLVNMRGLASASNGGHGLKLNGAKYAPLLESAHQYNTGDGVNCTSVLNSSFINVDATGNGANGYQFVSGCDDNFIIGSSARSNTGDGIKLTATSDNNTMGTALNLVSNGGYGINIAASTCDNNTIAVPYFENNTSGDYNDSGTGTNIVATVIQPDEQIFTSNGTWTKPDNVKLVTVEVWGGGGGGGGGGNNVSGGTGGGGGAYITRVFQASELGSTETITVGAGGTGGAAGNGGSAGGTSSFGTWLYAYGGGGGARDGGAASHTGGGGGGVAGAGAAGSNNASTGLGGLPASTAGVSGVSGQGGGGKAATDGTNGEYGGGSGGGVILGTSIGKGGSSLYAGGGGGAGSISSSQDATDGGSTRSYVAGGGGAGATTAGAAGSAGAAGCGGGGGKGIDGASTTGGAGGAGGVRGGGGGGGGNGSNGSGSGTGGAGGNGGRGEVRVYSI